MEKLGKLKESSKLGLLRAIVVENVPQSCGSSERRKEGPLLGHPNNLCGGQDMTQSDPMKGSEPEDK